MKATIEIGDKNYKVELNQGISIAIPFMQGENHVSAWYVPPISVEPVRADGWVGAVAEGGSVNFNTLSFNPHGNGTHTECIGHITSANEKIKDLISDHFHFAELITITPDNNQILEQLDWNKINKNCNALIIRTTPNDSDKLTKQYSNTNPPFISEKMMELIVKEGIEHLLIDLPSVDPEHDEGKLIAHRIFWDHLKGKRRNCSITEMVYIPNEVEDGTYLLNLQFLPFDNDASPSNPILYRLSKD